MPIITLFLMNLIVIITAFIITYKILKRSNFIDSLICWFIICFALIIFIELALGILSILNLQNVILLSLLILMVIGLIAKNRISHFSLMGVKESISELFNNRIILLGISLILGFALIKICINLINPPFGFDCLNYHFVFPVDWLKHGNLDIPIFLSDTPSNSYYPMNGSLFFLWLMLPLKNVFMADLGQIPFFILAFLATYNISRKIGLNKEFSFYAAGLFLITPNFFKEIEIAYIDIIVAALFLASINFLWSLYENINFKDLILWALSFGLFLGTKPVSVAYGIFTFIFFIFVLLKNIKKFGFNRIFFYFIIFLSLVLITGGFSYIRNFIQTGNPFYPVNVKLFGRSIFKGVMPISYLRGCWSQDDFNLRKLLFCEGLGAQFILFAIPGVFLSIPAFLIKRNKNTDFYLIFILSLPILLYLSFLFLIPQQWTRYLYSLLGISFVVAMYTLDLLNIPKKAVRTIVSICFLTSITEFAGHIELVISIIFSIIFFIILPRILRLKFNLRFALITFLLIIVILHFLNINYDKYEFHRYLLRSHFPQGEKEAWQWLNNNTDGSRIAYTGRPDVLPLYGTNFKNDVLYVSVNAIHPAKLHYFPNARYIWTNDFMALHKNLEKRGNYRENPDYNLWFSNLKFEKIDYLLVYSILRVKETAFPIEDEWAKNHPEIFELVFRNNEVHIYKIKI